MYYVNEDHEGSPWKINILSLSKQGLPQTRKWLIVVQIQSQFRVALYHALSIPVAHMCTQALEISCGDFIRYCEKMRRSQYLIPVDTDLITFAVCKLNQPEQGM